MEQGPEESNDDTYWIRPPKVVDLNPSITCALCTGYLIDAITINECMHSFCRSCIITHLKSQKQEKECPKCQTTLEHPPLNALEFDRKLQSLTYAIVPGLEENEAKRRQVFCETDELPSCQTLTESCVLSSKENKTRESESVQVALSQEPVSAPEIPVPSAFHSSPLLPPFDSTEVVPLHEAVNLKLTSKNPSKVAQVEKCFIYCAAAATIEQIKKLISFHLKDTLNWRKYQVHVGEKILPDFYHLKYIKTAFNSSEQSELTNYMNLFYDIAEMEVITID